MSKRDMNINHSCLTQLNNIVLKNAQNIVDGLAQDKNIKANLKKVWGNHNFNHNICTPHTHRDSFLSAVYYSKSTDGKIHFYSPWTDAIYRIYLLMWIQKNLMNTIVLSMKLM